MVGFFFFVGFFVCFSYFFFPFSPFGTSSVQVPLPRAGAGPRAVFI